MEKSKEIKGYNGIFASRFRALLDERKVTQKYVAEKTHSKEQTISQYRNGEVLPNAEKLYEISKCFDVSSDYLLGISDNPSCDMQIREISKITGLTEHSIEKLKHEAKLMCEFGHTDMPQEGLKVYLSKTSDSNTDPYPKFHTINLLLTDSPINLNYTNIIQTLGEILAFRMQPKNIKPHEEICYGLFKHLDEVRVDEDGYEDDFIFDTNESPSYFLGHNEILDILLLRLQEDIKRYKDEHEKDER